MQSPGYFIRKARTEGVQAFTDEDKEALAAMVEQRPIPPLMRIQAELDALEPEVPEVPEE